MARFFDYTWLSGYQQIVFASADKRIQRLPADVLDRIREYEVATDEVSGLVRAPQGTPV